MPNTALPVHLVPRAAWSAGQTDPAAWIWDSVPGLPPFVLADGSGPARQQTLARVCCDDRFLYVRFDCNDQDIWGSYTERDDPIYDEEVVELFLSAGTETPARYFEFELSPNGVVLDAAIFNPGTARDAIVVDLSWDCPELCWHVARDDAAGRWWAVLAVPWAPLLGDGARPAEWRANFYRIERQRGAADEFSCWSATLTQPADFHKPARFGMLRIDAAS